MNRSLFWLLLPVSLVAILFLAAVFLTVLAFLPPAVTWVALILFVLVLLWFFLGRRSSRGPVSEASLLGRQTSKEGLL